MSSARFEKQIVHATPTSRHRVAIAVVVIAMMVLPAVASAQTGGFSGRITDRATGEPLFNFGVEIWNEDGLPTTPLFVDTRPDGTYDVTGLEPGTYYAVADKAFFPFLHLRQAYGGKSCRPGLCDPTSGQPIVVEAGATVTGIDFAMVLAGTISGRIVDAASGAPLSNVSVHIHDDRLRSIGSGSTDADGRYQAVGIAHALFEDEYYVVARGIRTRREVFDDVLCPQFPVGCDVSKAEPVVVRETADTGGVDFALANDAWIRGRVVGADDGVGLRDGVVRAYDAERRLVGLAFTELTGDYTIASLPPGQPVYLVAEAGDRSAVLHDGRPCPGGSCDPLVGEPLVPNADQPLEGIDFELAAGDPCADALCLVDERFRVIADWTDTDGDSGRARSVRLTDGSGYLWFFDEANVELVVKVLDGCAINGRYWIFAAGLTDTGVRLRIDDTAANTGRTYESPAGQPFTPLTDTTALATCDVD